jgi:hypothetical protein
MLAFGASTKNHMNLEKRHWYNFVVEEIASGRPDVIPYYGILSVLREKIEKEGIWRIIICVPISS